MAESQTRLEKVITRLREQGHRLTPQRMAVLKVVIGNKKHPSAEQIYERVKVDFPMTSLATIYKTLAVLKEMGEVLEIDPHPHLICIKCSSIKDVDVTGLDGLPRKVAQKTGYRIVSHRFDFFGICPQCQENE
jgi:Fur family peroxide stress response transcriptional regulator